MVWSSLQIFTTLVTSPWNIQVEVLVPRPGQDHRDVISLSCLVPPHIPDENDDAVRETWHTLNPKTADNRLTEWQLLASVAICPTSSNTAQCAIQTVKVRLDRLPSLPRGTSSSKETPILGHVDSQGPRLPIAIHSFKVSLAPSSAGEPTINLEGKESLANGFQSWSKSQPGQDTTTVFEKPNWLYHQLTQLGLASDMDIYEYSGQRGLVHSSIWTILRDKVDSFHARRIAQDTSPSSLPPPPVSRRPDELVFCGSLSENLGYTYFIMDHVASTMTISQDVKGKILSKQGDTLELKSFFAWGDNDANVWDKYAAAWKSTLGDRRVIKDSLHQQVSGWTSWYLHYENISEAVVLENLGCFSPSLADGEDGRSSSSNWPAKVIQIDDGYTIVGDWLDVDQTKFPNGMKHVADRIRERGLMPGLWMAPFCASRKSKLVQEHPEWFIQSPEGEGSNELCNLFSCCGIPRDRHVQKLMLAHPAFHAGAVALDLENPQVRDHLANVFRVVTQEWGFRILKLDFLFAAAQVPRNGKTRGQLMWEAMQMVRDWVADSETLLLGCGVPLGSAMMLTDYCRIGCDVGASWDSPQRFFHDREYISTFNSLTSVLSRWGLSGRFFGNDPDVYFTRTWSMGLSRQERLTLMSLNHLLGHLVLTSDPMDLHKMNDDQKWMLTLFHPWPSMPGLANGMPAPRIVRVIQPLVNQKDVYLVHVEWNERVLIVAVNLTSKRQQVCLNVLDRMIARDHGERMENASVAATTTTSTSGNMHASIYFHSVLGLFGAASSAYTLQKRETVVFVRIKDTQGRLCLAPPATWSPLSSKSFSWRVLTTRCGHFLPTAEIASVENDQIRLHPLPAGLTRSTQVWLARPIIDSSNTAAQLQDPSASLMTVAAWTVNDKEVQLEPSCSTWAAPSHEIGSVWI